MTNLVRFKFGENWLRYAAKASSAQMSLAGKNLAEIIDDTNLKSGDRFLDVGSGSGLFSFQASRLGLQVTSFDFDELSVKSTQSMREQLNCSDDLPWTIHRGSILDSDFLKSLGQFDLVYCWGVAHHTGDMWQALENLVELVAPDKFLYLAIYNDQGWRSKAWKWVKRTYCESGQGVRWFLLGLSFLRLWLPTILKDLVFFRDPLHSWRNYSEIRGRGMSPWFDLIDWVGGYPFEVTSVSKLQRFFTERGFSVTVKFDCKKGLGCNEFLLRRID